MSQQMYRHEKLSSGSNALPKSSKKLEFYQVATGILLTCFIFGHLLLVSSILLGVNFFNALAYFLEVTYIELLILPIILLIMFTHFIVAARKFPFRQGELVAMYKHSKSMKHAATWAWSIQAITAIALLALASTHIFQVLLDLPITAEKSAARMQADGATLFYSALLFCSWLHVGIGIFRLGVKYGYITAENRSCCAKKLAIVIALCIFLGFLAEIMYNSIDLEPNTTSNTQAPKLEEAHNSANLGSANLSIDTSKGI